jgi:mannosyltransferase OCH1-like enzyme
MPIPRRIIQTHRDPAIQQELRQGWRERHPGYEYLFFDDADCRRFIGQQLPALLPTYDKLPLPVQKADLFRYAAVYTLGGVYADVDTECMAALHDYVDLSQDQFVVGIEMTPADFREGLQRYVQQYCSPHQILQWTFCAPPRHPALGALIERINFLVTGQSAQTLAHCSHEPRFTLELTGPILFTQVVNEFLSDRQTQGRVTVLPRLVWGSWLDEHRRPELASQIRVRHLFQGSWKPAPVRAARIPRVNYRLDL